MKIKFKKLTEDAIIPSYAKSGDAGLDLYATTAGYYSDRGFYEYGTGIAVEIPKGYVGLLFPRSSVSKMDLSLANSVGVVDSGYRGEIKLRFKDTVTKKSLKNIYKVGDRVAQLVIIPYPEVELEEVDQLDDSERSSGGFGSSGR